MKTISIQGIKHLIKKNKKGDIVVEHTNINNGKYDKLNLTKMAKVKTVSEGVKATKKWHKENPYKKEQLKTIKK
jgi:hypothetical protein